LELKHYTSIVLWRYYHPTDTSPAVELRLAILKEVIVSSLPMVSTSCDGLSVNHKRFSKPPFVKSAAVKMLV